MNEKYIEFMVLVVMGFNKEIFFFSQEFQTKPIRNVRFN